MNERIIAGLVGSWLLIGQTAPASEWTRADVETVRLPPARIVGVPSAVQRELEWRGCTIPQPFTAKSERLENAISGRFISAASTDWAVLCSRQRRSAILVFRGGGVATIDELAEEADAGRLQVTGLGEIGYSRALYVASPRDIREHNPDADPPLPVLDHDGFHDLFVEKASVIFYWSGGRWLRLAGANAPTLRSNSQMEPTRR